MQETRSFKIAKKKNRNNLIMGSKEITGLILLKILDYSKLKKMSNNVLILIHYN